MRRHGGRSTEVRGDKNREVDNGDSPGEGSTGGGGIESSRGHWEISRGSREVGGGVGIRVSEEDVERNLRTRTLSWT